MTRNLIGLLFLLGACSPTIIEERTPAPDPAPEAVLETPVVYEEPILAAPMEVMGPCGIGDDGIGGTGCP